MGLEQRLKKLLLNDRRLNLPSSRSSWANFRFFVTMYTLGHVDAVPLRSVNSVDMADVISDYILELDINIFFITEIRVRDGLRRLPLQATQ